MRGHARALGAAHAGKTGSASQTGSGIGADTLATNLATTSVEIQTVADGSEPGDIHVNADVSWNAATTLTLTAHHDVNVNALISNAAGGVTLRADSQGACVAGAASSACGTVNFAGTGRITAANVNLYYNPTGSNAAAGANGIGPIYAPTNYAANVTVTGTLNAYMLVNDVNQLQAMSTRLDGRYALGRNIDASATRGWNGGEGFVPIGNSTTPFIGHFDGLGHTVSELFIDRPGTDHVGLFGVVDVGSTTIRSVGLLGGSISGNFNVGALVGDNEGTVSDAYATAAVRGAFDQVGGLVGFNLGTVSNAYASGAVNGDDDVGGLVGDNWGTLSNAYASGAVSGDLYVGGFVGRNMGTLSNAYASGAVSGNREVGGLVGRNDNGTVSGTVSHSFWDLNTTGQATSAGGGISLDTSQFMTQASFGTAFDFTNTWFMVDGYTRPFLRSEYSTTITNAHQLQLMELDKSADYVLANDIDMSELRRSSGPWNSATGFVPIGGGFTSFTGSLDGAGHTITGLFINQSGFNGNTGLFRNLGSSATIADIGLIDVSITGGNNIGSLAGSNLGTITNAYSSGTVSGVVVGGGLVGINAGSGAISDAYSTAVVSGSASVGGLAGANGDSGGTIERAYATGAVSGSVSVGGLVGSNDSNGIIRDAYATGAISGTEFVGGLVGANSGAIARTYSTGQVTGTVRVGGLVGANFLGRFVGTVSDSFWDVETSGQADLSDGRGTGRTSAEMRDVDTFSAWNIAAAGGSSAVWRIYDGYTGPLLRSFLTDITVAVDDISATYNGSDQTFNVTFDAGVADASRILTSSATFRNAGTYSVGNRLYSGQQG